VVTAQTSDQVVSTVPVNFGETVIAVVRAASSRTSLRHRIWWAWAALSGLAVAAVGCAGLLAASQSRRLSRPLIALEQAATELGGGNFAVRTARSGVPEIDRAGESLDRTARRLSELMARERDFSANASHQLRTPLTTLRLQLETGLQSDRRGLEEAAAEAIRYADQLEETIDDVLALARSSGQRGAGFEVEELFAGIRQRWHGTLAAVDRPLRLVEKESVASSASLPAARQIVDVLLDNAYRHGKGAVTVEARVSSDALAIDVADEGDASGLLVATAAGRQPPLTSGGSLGLALARSLAESEGGRLLFASDQAGTRITVLLPIASPSASSRNQQS
jgi:signal transduction histidine kinase